MPDVLELLTQLVGERPSWTFAALLIPHMAAGLIAVVAGATAMLSPKRRGRHPKAGRTYYAMLWVVGATAVGMAAMRWPEDAYLVVLGALSLGAASLGYLARHYHWRGWIRLHIMGMGTSYIVLLTAFYVDNGPRLPLWDRLPVLAFWIVPSLIGLPLIARAVRCFPSMSAAVRGLVLGCALVLVSGLPAPSPAASSVTAQLAASGRVLAASRGQVAWLDLLAPRPTQLTQLVRPAYPADVAAASSVPFAVASVVSALPTGGAMGGDLLVIDLRSGTIRTLLSRQSDGESLDMPAIWPDGSGVVYQRSNLRAAVPMPGQAQPQYQSRIEQVAPDGSGAMVLLDDARYPGPAADGTSLAFVRSTARGTGIFSHSLVDGSDQELVAPGQFLALAYPRFSPDGTQLAFAAISLVAPIGAPPSILDGFGPRHAMAHGFPWEAWLVNADGSGLRQLPDVVDDDPSVAWSPDGTQLLVYGGWGSFLVDAASGDATSLPFLAGYGSVAWLPD